MSQVRTTGFVLVTSGQNTSIDLREVTSVVSARVRWRGVTKQSTTTKTVTKSIENAKNEIDYAPNSIDNSIPAVPAGGTFKHSVLSTKVWNRNGGTVAYLAAVTSNPDTGGSTTTERTNAPNNDGIEDTHTYTTDYTGRSITHFGLTDPNMQGSQSIEIMAVATTYYTETQTTTTTTNTSYPRVTVGGKSTEHSGEIANGNVTSWYNLTGLTAGQVNNISHLIGGSGVANCEIEYTVIAPPVVKTNEAASVSYSTATLNGEITVTSENPSRYFEYGTSPSYGSVIDKGIGGVGAFSHDLAGLQFDALYYYRAYATNGEGTGYGAQKTFRTLYPYLNAPVREAPIDGLRTAERMPWFELTLTSNANNPATKYHARIRLSEYVDMSNPLLVIDSSQDQSNWQLWDGAAWVAFPAAGVTPGSRVRGKPSEDLPLRALYWDATGFDGQRYGTDSTSRSIRILLTVNGLYTLLINEQEYSAYEIGVKETANGEIGEISFSINNEPVLGVRNNEIIQYGDEVKLGVNDALGNKDEFKGIVRSKQPQNNALQITAITGSGILGDRRVKQDYPSQDIGLTVKAIVDTYCQPLTSSNVNTATGIVAPIIALDQTPLKVFEDIRRQFGVLYFIDKDWDTHLYLPAVIGAAFTTVQNGG